VTSSAQGPAAPSRSTQAPAAPFTAGNTPDAPRSDLLGLLEALASDLRAIGYTVDGVAELLGEAAHSALGRDQLIPALIVTGRSLGEPATAALAGTWIPASELKSRNAPTSASSSLAPPAARSC